jgi:hypothetical protein
MFQEVKSVMEALRDIGFVHSATLFNYLQFYLLILVYNK